MIAAERRYRRLLRVLPPWYRERYGEEMVEVYLAGRASDDERPGVGEIAATVRTATVARLRAVGRPSVATLWLVALAGATLLATQALWGVWVTVRHYLTAETSWLVGADGRLTASVPTWDVGEVLGASGEYRVAWVVVLVLLLAGLRRGAVVVALLVGLLDVSAGLGPLVGQETVFLEVAWARTDARAVLVPLLVVAALALVPGSSGTRPGGVSRFLAAGVTVTAVGTVWTVARGTDLGDGTSWSGLAVAVALAAVVVAVAGRRLAPAWPAAVLALGAVTVLAGPLPDGALVEDRGSIVGGMLLAAAAVVLAALAWSGATGRRAPERRPRPERTALSLG